MLSSLVHWAAAALFLCPYDTRAFVTLPGPCSPNLKTSLDRHRHGHCHTRDSLRLEAGGGGGGGGGVGGDSGDGGYKPPRSVLQRPWDVEVDLHGERHIITVQPGDSILEAVSAAISVVRLVQYSSINTALKCWALCEVLVYLAV